MRIKLSSNAPLHFTVLHSTIYRCALRLYITINISIRYGSECLPFCCSYVFCHNMVTNNNHHNQKNNTIGWIQFKLYSKFYKCEDNIQKHLPQFDTYCLYNLLYPDRYTKRQIKATNYLYKICKQRNKQ